ncbi:hypothetical protein DP42_4565 [Burkholderia pseudomallei]|nr:hypothetical protein DP42_4565 [Burkholderia pseudomallei]
MGGTPRNPFHLALSGWLHCVCCVALKERTVEVTLPFALFCNRIPILDLTIVDHLLGNHHGRNRTLSPSYSLSRSRAVMFVYE